MSIASALLNAIRALKKLDTPRNDGLSKNDRQCEAFSFKERSTLIARHCEAHNASF
jgi:hypothetical protein